MLVLTAERERICGECLESLGTAFYPYSVGVRGDGKFILRFKNEVPPEHTETFRRFLESPVEPPHEHRRVDEVRESMFWDRQRAHVASSVAQFFELRGQPGSEVASKVEAVLEAMKAILVPKPKPLHERYCQHGVLFGKACRQCSLHVCDDFCSRGYEEGHKCDPEVLVQNARWFEFKQHVAACKECGHVCPYCGGEHYTYLCPEGEQLGNLADPCLWTLLGSRPW